MLGRQAHVIATLHSMADQMAALTLSSGMFQCSSAMHGVIEFVGEIP
jgi:hypothetical protein